MLNRISQTVTDKENIIKRFVDNFILKDKRERALVELTNSKKREKFVDRLNHKWETLFDMRFLKQVDKQNDSSIEIQKLLKIQDDDLCYVISNYEEFDDKVIRFHEAFDALYSMGLGSVIINMSADTIFLDTEQVQGPAPRFIGHKTY